MAFKIEVRPQALFDTYEIIDWYSKISTGLGKRFYLQIKQHYKFLKSTPLLQVRYDNVRCLPVDKFPYMIHFIVEEKRKCVIVIGIISTDRNPQIRNERTK